MVKVTADGCRSFGGGFTGWETSADIQLDTVLICFDPVFVKVEITTDPFTCKMHFFDVCQQESHQNNMFLANIDEHLSIWFQLCWMFRNKRACM